MSNFMHSKIFVICLHSSHLIFQRTGAWFVFHISSMVSWILAFKHNQILVPKTLQKITFYGKKDLVDAIKLRTLRLEYYSELLGGTPNTIPDVLVRERGRGKIDTEEQKAMRQEKQDLEWHGDKPRNVSCHQRLEGATGNRFSPGATQGSTVLLTPSLSCLCLSLDAWILPL